MRKVISRSTFELQTVTEALIESATRLCQATRGHIFQFDGNFFVLPLPTALGRDLTDIRRPIRCVRDQHNSGKG